MDEPAVPPPSNPPIQPPSPLTYEETPIIENVPPPQPQTSQPTPVPVKKRSSSCLKTIGIIILVIVLFIGGIWLSSFVRQWIPSPTNQPKTNQPLNGTPTPLQPVDPYATWTSYAVTSGVTRLPVDGLSFKLPPDVLSPICDGTSCISQGTYLPGGTRLTVAARGIGQSLRDFRGTIITDANGIGIPTKQLVLPDFTATEYTSSSSGRTISGYAFSQIRGVMLPLTDTLSVEVNHFAPLGIIADFTADDVLFDSIVKTFTYKAIKPSGTPTVTIIPAVFPTATSSGY